MKKYFNTFNLHCKFLGFSLVELMISLITISLITAAMAPVITKKLSAGTITVGSFGGGNSSYTGEPRSQEDCDKISTSLMFISSTDSGNPKNLCVTRYNIGDHADLQIPTSAVPAENIFSAGSGDNKCKADYVTPCCWTGNTTGSNCDSANGSYSGCNRTVCNWYAADNICNMLNVKGQTGFRLPTKDELGNLNPDKFSKSTSAYAGDNGLMFCDFNAGYNSARCSRAEVCPSSYTGYCSPDRVWSGTLDGSTNAFNRYLNSGSWHSNSFYRTHAWSVRCVIDNITIQESGSGGGSSVDMGSIKKTMCDMLDNKYWDESEKSCKTCSEDIPNCERCSNNTTCTVCTKGYLLVDGACTKVEAAPKSQADCNEVGSQLVYVETDSTQKTGLCVTQYNMGDGNFSIPIGSIDENIEAGVTKGDGYCDNKKCCWHGTTSSNACNNINGSYSGCNRTVCNWEAANSICNNLSYGGYSNWRLPTKDELEKMNPNIYSKTTSDHAGDKGLMFCDHWEVGDSSFCQTTGACSGAMNNSCYPYDVRTGTTENLENAYRWSLQNGEWEVVNNSRLLAMSVRCVLDNISNQIPISGSFSTSCSNIDPNCKLCSNSKCFTCNDGYKVENDKCVLKYRFGEPEKQEDCAPYNATFIDKKYNGNYRKNVCVTNVVVGYHYGPKLFVGTDESKIINDVGVQCNHSYSSACCWKGNVNTNYYTTVCGYIAANSSCNNYLNGSGTSWSLPSEDLVNGWIEAYNGNISSKFREYVDATLCTNVSVSGKRLCDFSYKCIGAKDNACIPARNWALGVKTYELTNGALGWTPGTVENNAVHARCVSSYVVIK